MESEKGLSVSTLTIQEWICAPSVCGGYTCELLRVDCLKKIVFHIVLQLVAIPEASYAVHAPESYLIHFPPEFLEFIPNSNRSHTLYLYKILQDYFV